MAGLGPDGLSLGAAYSEVLSGSYTSGNWYDTNLTRNDLQEGNYILMVYVSTFLTGASMYYCQGVSAPFRWHPHPSNNGNRCTLTFSSPFMGHAPNSFTQVSSFIEFGILHKPQGAEHVMQVKFNSTNHTLNGTDGRAVNFYLYKYS